MIKHQEINERKEADMMYAEAHRARRGELVRISKTTLIAIPPGVDREEYLERWQKDYKRFCNRVLDLF